jgi:hypothetical protein
MGARVCWSPTRPAAELRSLSRLVGEAGGEDGGGEGAAASLFFLPPAGGLASARPSVSVSHGPTDERERGRGMEEEARKSQPWCGWMDPFTSGGAAAWWARVAALG